MSEDTGSAARDLRIKKLVYYTIVALAGAAGFLFLLYLWFNIMPWEALGKIILTLAVVAGVLCIFIVVRSDLQSEEKLKRDKYMD